MADWSFLYVGKSEVLRWRNSNPEDDDLALSFLFRPGDRVFDVNSKRPATSPSSSEPDESDDEYDCWYQTSVRIALDRLDRMGMSLPNLDRWIAEACGIPIETVDLAVLNPADSDLGLAVAGPLDGTKLEERYLEAVQGVEEVNYWEGSYRVDSANLDPLPTLRKLRYILETSPPEATVYLAPCYTSDWSDEPDALEKFRLFSIDYDGGTQIERNPLTDCKVHYASRQFDLVYIELVIAMEREIEAYLVRRFAPQDMDSTISLGYAQDLLKQLSSIPLLRFILEILEGRHDLKDLISEVDKVYNVRNNVVHRGQRNFQIPAVYAAIVVAESLVELLRGLHPVAPRAHSKS